MRVRASEAKLSIQGMERVAKIRRRRPDFDGDDNIVHILGNYHRKLVPLVLGMCLGGFRDLEDNDGDEDEEDFRLSWDTASSDDEMIDEPDRYNKVGGQPFGGYPGVCLYDRE